MCYTLSYSLPFVHLHFWPFLKLAIMQLLSLSVLWTSSILVHKGNNLKERRERSRSVGGPARWESKEGSAQTSVEEGIW